LRFCKLGLLFYLSCSWIFGEQLFSVGVKGGIPMTDAFAIHQVGATIVSIPVIRTGDFSPNPPGEWFTTTFPALPIPTTAVNESSRASRNYLIGPTVEVHLPLGISVEADALYRKQSQPGVLLAIVGLNSLLAPPIPHDYTSWEFPVLGKYRFNAPIVRPFIAAGPSFRAVESPLNHYWSKAGATAGVGVEGKLLHLRIAPEVRYTHWGKDSGDARLFFASKRNQAEFLIGLAF
jgi:hypothetical protein